MSREAHVRFWESAGVRLPRATHLRSGIEATNSEYKRAYGGGRLRVRGSPAVTRTVVFKFMALNIRRWTKCAQKTHNQAA